MVNVQICITTNWNARGYPGLIRRPYAKAWSEIICYPTFIPGGCHVPSPAGNIEGASLFGQYRRITR